MDESLADAELVYLSAPSSEDSDAVPAALLDDRVTTLEAAKRDGRVPETDCIVVDQRFDGALPEAIAAIREAVPGVPILVLFRDPSPELIEATMERGATDFTTPETQDWIALRIRNLIRADRTAAGAGSPGGGGPLDSLNEAVFAIDESFTITLWNDAMATGTEIAAADAIGSSLFDLVPDLAGTEYATAIRDAMDAETAVDRVRTEGLSSDGPIELRLHPTADGLTVHELAVDPADRRDANLLQAVLTDLFVDIEEVLYFKDEQSRFIRLSESFAELRGTTREELLGKTDFDTMTEAEARLRYENEQRIMDTGEVIEDPDERLVTPSGDVEWYHSKKAPLYDETGEVMGTLGISREITDLKELERTLTELEAIIDRVPVSLFALDEDEAITWANRTAKRMFTTGDDSLVDSSLASLTADGYIESAFREAYTEAFDRLHSESTTEETAVIDDVMVRPDDDQPRICDVHVRLLPLGEDAFSGAVIAFHDVTEQVQQEAKLARQYARLERLVETISHDLRNPLSVALGRVEVAAETGEEAQLEASIDALERIDGLVDDLVTMARLGRTVEEPEDVSVATVAERAWQPFEAGSATLSVEDAGTVRADPDRLLRLFENLFRNAVDHGQADVTVRVGPTGRGFFVADDGPGIPEDVRERVFDHGFTTEETGTGLGLSIVDEIASAHGWTVSVEESDTGGTRFEFLTDA